MTGGESSGHRESLGFQEWRSRFVVEKVHRMSTLLSDSAPRLLPCAGVRADPQKEGSPGKVNSGKSLFVRPSPPAAKLGAVVEKSPGPSLFFAFSNLGAVAQRLLSPDCPLVEAFAPGPQRAHPGGSQAAVERPCGRPAQGGRRQGGHRRPT